MEGKNAELLRVMFEALDVVLRAMIQVAEVSGLSGEESDALFRKAMSEFTKRDPSKLRGF